MVTPAADPSVGRFSGHKRDGVNGSADANDSAMTTADDGLLVDAGFFAQSSFSKEAKAVANACLTQMLEAGPSSLELVKEAVGALKALCTGVLREAICPADELQSNIC